MKHFQAIPEASHIDEENGIIRRVSLIRIGNAEGHFDSEGRQEAVDARTLEQVYICCFNAGSIKVKADHGSGVLSTIGYLKNFAIENDRVIGDLHIYQTADEKARILEVAAKNPHHMGISLEFEGGEEPAGDKTFSRCKRVLTAALVSDPAANTSLFSAINNTKQTNKTMPDNNTLSTEDRMTALEKQFEDCKAEYAKKYGMGGDEDTPSLEERVNELSKKFEDMMTKFAKKFEDDDEPKPEPQPELDPAPEPQPEPEDEDKKIEFAAKRAAENAVKAFAASIGVTTLGKPGAAPAGKPAVKLFEEHVADVAIADFKGDQNAARAAILTNKVKYPDAWKAYEASRPVKHS